MDAYVKKIGNLHKETQRILKQIGELDWQSG